MLSKTLALGLALALFTVFTVGASLPESAQAPADPTHTVTIEYAEDRGDLRAATLTIAPLREGIRPPWQGELDAITVLSKSGQWIYVDRLLSYGHSTGVKAEVMLPAPDAILMVGVHTREGGWIGWQLVEDAYVVTQDLQDWTYYDGSGNRVQPEGGCSTDGCRLVDPWTCECFDSIRDPYESYNQSETLASSFTI